MTTPGSGAVAAFPAEGAAEGAGEAGLAAAV